MWAKLPNGSQIPLRPTSKDEFEELGYQKVHEVHYFVSNDVNKGSLHPHPCTACSIHEFSWLYAIKSHNCTYSLRLRCSHKPQLSIRMPLFHCSNMCCSAIVPKQWRSCHPRTGASTQTLSVPSTSFLIASFVLNPLLPLVSPLIASFVSSPLFPPSPKSEQRGQSIRVSTSESHIRVRSSEPAHPSHPSPRIRVGAF